MRVEKKHFWSRYEKVQQAEPTERVTNKAGNLYAILFTAEVESPMSNDIMFAYDSLIKSGTPKANLSVLEGDGKRNNLITGPATVSELENAVDSVRQKANSNDSLLVYVANHGKLINGQSTFITHGGRVYEKDFEQMTQDLPVNFGLFYFDFCNAGGFAERMGYGKNMGVSTVGKTERGARCIFHKRSPTTINFFNALKEETIESAFDVMAYENTFLPKKFLCFLPKSIPPPYHIETPQLRWQNADPSQLYLLKR